MVSRTIFDRQSPSNPLPDHDSRIGNNVYFLPSGDPRDFCRDKLLGPLADKVALSHFSGLVRPRSMGRVRTTSTLLQCKYPIYERTTTDHFRSSVPTEGQVHEGTHKPLRPRTWAEPARANESRSYDIPKAKGIRIVKSNWSSFPTFLAYRPVPEHELLVGPGWNTEGSGCNDVHLLHPVHPSWREPRLRQPAGSGWQP